MTNGQVSSDEQVFSHPRVLHSWKEIASYMGRGVRTIQRYESHLGLPVRRPSGAPRSAVLAFTQEIDQWLANSPTKVESELVVKEKEEHTPVKPKCEPTVQLVYHKALLGQQRADAMQKRLEATQILLAQLTIRMRTSAERYKEMRMRSAANRGILAQNRALFVDMKVPGEPDSPGEE